MSTIEHIVMARVRRVHRMRQLTHPTLMKIYSSVLLFGALGSMVSIVSVFANMPSLTSPVQVATFTLNAIMHTDMFVQLVVIGIALVLALLVRDMVHIYKQKQNFFLPMQHNA